MSTRTIHTAHGAYRYRHGKQSTVIITPEGKRLHAYHSKILQCSPTDLERMVWKNGGYTVKPSDVRDYIERITPPTPASKGRDE